MKKQTINITRILLIMLLTGLSIFVFFNKKPLETNILKAVLTNNHNDSILVELSKRQSNRLNVIFEGPDYESVESAFETFDEKIDKNLFSADNTNVSEMINTYKRYHNGLLSSNSAKLIKAKQYETIKQQSYERLYNPLGLNLLPLDRDPFLLLTDYLLSLGNERNSQETEKDNKYYKILQFNIKKELALSPTLLNQQMKNLIELKDSISLENPQIKIYLSGAPVHTYNASSKSMTETNLICILSSLFIILLCKFYFNSFKILIPIASSLSLAMYTGYLAVSVFFDSIHILTFVFASTLIGICVDYCLHYFAHNKQLSTILPSLTQSLLTTVCAFFVLLLSNIELLKQISVYTITGLVTVYLTVVLFYPLLCKKIELPEMKNIKLPLPEKKYRRWVIGLMMLIALSGFFNIKFNDDIKDMYIPPKSLAESEKLYAELTHKDFNINFIIVNAVDIQKLLEKEEKISECLDNNNIEYYSLSRFVPSIKRQKENYNLIKQLYNASLKSYAAPFLQPESINNLLKIKEPKGFLTPDNTGMPVLKDFLYNEKNSVMIVNADTNVISQSLASLDKTTKADLSVVNLKNDISQKVGNCRKICMALFIPAIVFLYVILVLIYKPLNALKIVLPPFLGAVFAIGIIGITGTGLNLFHILALFLIIGFTMDYSIFRFNGSSSSNSGSAVLISCATSVFSFFLLSITSFKLISSLGFILWVGLLSSYILSVLLISKPTGEQTLRQ